MNIKNNNMMIKRRSKNGLKSDKRIFGWFEVIFDILYLCTAAAIGLRILMDASKPVQTLAGIMALVLAGGDMFHLVPRIAAAVTGMDYRLRKAIGLGKLIASVTMTVFYVLLWHIGLQLFPSAVAQGWTAVVYALAVLRTALCFFRQNKWYDEDPPVNWSVFATFLSCSWACRRPSSSAQMRGPFRPCAGCGSLSL